MSDATFWILTALADGRRHGYEILQEAAAASDGSAALKTTTLYAALERLERERLIAPDGEEIVAGRARRYYVLTDAGSAALGAEVTAIEQRARVAKARLAERQGPLPARGRLASITLGPAAGAELDPPDRQTHDAGSNAALALRAFIATFPAATPPDRATRVAT